MISLFLRGYFFPHALGFFFQAADLVLYLVQPHNLLFLPVEQPAAEGTQYDAGDFDVAGGDTERR